MGLDPAVSRNAHLIYSAAKSAVTEGAKKPVLYVDRHNQIQRAGMLRRLGYALQAIFTFDLGGKHAAVRHAKVVVIEQLTLKKICEHLKGVLDNFDTISTENREAIVKNAIYITKSGGGLLKQFARKEVTKESILNIRPTSIAKPTPLVPSLNNRTQASKIAAANLFAKLVNQKQLSFDEKLPFDKNLEPLDILEARIHVLSNQLAEKIGIQKAFRESTVQEFTPKNQWDNVDTELKISALKHTSTQERKINEFENNSKR